MKHPSWVELSGYVDNALDTHRWAAVARHIRDCRECTDAIADLTAESRALQRTLGHDPGDAYFANFASGVEARIEVEAAARSRAPAGVTRGWARWWESPGGLSLAGAVAAVVVAAGVVLVMGRGPSNVLRDAGVLERNEQSAPDVLLDESLPPETNAPGAPGADGAAGGSPTAQDRDAAGAKSAEPARAYEVRRNAQGEDERVGPRDALRPGESAPAGQSVEEGKSVTSAKQRAAQPLGTQEMSRTKALAAPSPMVGRSGRSDAGTDVRMCGEVHDATGRPLRFAIVVLPNRNLSATTDDHGRFCLYAPPGTDSMIVSMVGFRTVRRAVALRPDMSDQAISMDAVSSVNYVSPRAASVPAMAAKELAKTETQSNALASLPDTVQKMADLAVRMSGAATRSKDARQHEAAAAQWQRVLKYVEGTPLENESRSHIAEDRYRAWEAEPTNKRQQAAREALTAYLVRAPIGPERNRATLWLDKLDN